MSPHTAGLTQFAVGDTNKTPMNPPIESPHPPHTPWPAAAAAAALGCIAYATTLWGTFIYDDASTILGDWRVTQPPYWRLLLTEAYARSAPDQLWRPLVSFSFAIQHYLHGSISWPYHLVNVLLHAGVCAAIVLLGSKLAGLRAAWIAGILFAVHPIHVEAVAGLVGRAELGCALFTLIGLWLFLHTPSGGRVAGLCGCFILAMLCKEQGMLFPLLLLALLPVRGIYPKASSARRHDLYLVALFLLIGNGYYIWREWHIGFGWDRNRVSPISNPMVLSEGKDRLLMPLALLGRYTLLLLAPVQLSPDYGGAIIGSSVSLHDPYLYLGVAAVGLWLVLASVAIRRKAWAMLFCLLALGLTYGMVGNIVSLIGTIFGERLMYLPSAFLLLIAGMWIARLPKMIAFPLIAILVSLGGLRTVTYALKWNDVERFYVWAYHRQPLSYTMYKLAIEEHAAHGHWSAARQDAYIARRNLPAESLFYQKAIDADLALGDMRAAEEDYALAHRIMPREGFDYPPAYSSPALRRDRDPDGPDTRPRPQ